jgi:hypothetical protein
MKFKILAMAILMILSSAATASAQLTCYNQRMGYYPCPPEVERQVYGRQQASQPTATVNVYVMPQQRQEVLRSRSYPGYGSYGYPDRTYNDGSGYERDDYGYRNKRKHRSGYFDYDVYGRRIRFRGGFTLGRDTYEENGYGRDGGRYRRNDSYSRCGGLFSGPCYDDHYYRRRY